MTVFVPVGNRNLHAEADVWAMTAVAARCFQPARKIAVSVQT
jgi:hypothetical protein